MHIGGGTWGYFARLLRSTCVDLPCLGLALADKRPERVDLCDIPAHVFVPYSVVWEEQSRRQAGCFIREGPHGGCQGMKDRCHSGIAIDETAS